LPIVGDSIFGNSYPHLKQYLELELFSAPQCVQFTVFINEF